MLFSYKKIVAPIFLMFFSVFLSTASLATSFNSNNAANFYDLSPSKNFISLGVKGYQQTEDYTCGPAAVISLMQFYNRFPADKMDKASEMYIADTMGTTPEYGTSPKQMATWLKHHGFKVDSGKHGNLAMLRDNLRKGIPTLVAWIDWGGHWAVVTGYYQAGDVPNPEKDTIFLADPSAKIGNAQNPDGIRSVNAEQFQHMWFDAQYFKPGSIVKGVYLIAVPK